MDEFGLNKDNNVAENKEFDSLHNEAAKNINTEMGSGIANDAAVNSDSSVGGGELHNMDSRADTENGFYTIPYSINEDGGNNNDRKQETTSGSNGNSGFFDPATSAAPVFYKENYKKTKTHKVGFMQLLLVAVLGAVLGGSGVFAAIQFIAPVIQPSVQGMLKDSGLSSQTSATGGSVQKIEITKSDSAVTAIAQKVSPSIVGIKVTAASSQDFFLGQSQSTGEGSGIIIKSDGYILTNFHVIEGAISNNTNTLTQGAKIEVILPNQKDKSYAATVIGKDSKSDLAVLKIDAGTNLPAAELGDSSKLQQGELAVAIGNPGGLDYMGSVTAGIISGLNRTITTEDGKTLTLIQTDAAINPGNSGGALCNSQGQVIGINTIKISATGFEGLGFAIPINHAKEVADNLIQYKYVKGRPLIGISIRMELDATSAKQYGVPEGILVGEVTPFSAAEKAGIQQNDIITKFDGQAINTYAKLEELKNKHKPGDKVSVEIYRYSDKSTKTLTMILDEDKS